MLPFTARLTLGVLLCLAAPGALKAASVNPFDPSLSPGVHAFATCNLVSSQTGVDSAACSNAQIAQNPTTLTQVLGTGAAQADLRTGTLHATSSAQAYRFGADDLRANAAGVAQIFDTLTFGSGFTGVVELRMTVDGSMLASTAGSSIFGQIGASLFAFDDLGVELAQVAVSVEQYTSGGSFLANQFSYGLATDVGTNADALGNFDPSDVQLTLSMFFNVTAADPSITFGARLATSAGLGPFIALANQLQTNDVDFGNTARLSVIAPAGVTWTSSSGVFLVPEPPVAALLAAGALGLARLGRKRA
jgi:hypothetical protein